VTGVEVIIGNFSSKVRNILPEVEDQGQYFANWREKFPIMTSTPVAICFVIPQRKICVFYGPFD